MSFILCFNWIQYSNLYLVYNEAAASGDRTVVDFAFDTTANFVRSFDSVSVSSESESELKSPPSLR